MRIGFKLGLAFGFLLLLVCALGFMNYRAMSRSAADSTVIAREFLPMNTLGVALTQDLATTSLDMRVFIFTGNPKMYESALADIEQAEKRIADFIPQARTFAHVPKLQDIMETAPRLFREYRTSMQATKVLLDRAENAVAVMNSASVELEQSLVQLQTTILGFLLDSVRDGNLASADRRHTNLTFVNQIMLRVGSIRLLMAEAIRTKDMEVFDKITALSAANDRDLKALDAQMQTPQNRVVMTQFMESLLRYREQVGVVRAAWQQEVELGKERMKSGSAMQNIVSEITRNSMTSSSTNALQTAEANESAVSAMLLMLGLALLLGVGVSIVLTRLITGPIKQNAAFAQAVANGQLDQQLTYRGTDELGALSDALRWMVDALKTRIADANDKSEQARIKGEEAHAAMETAREAQKEAEQAKQAGMLAAADRLEGVTTVLSSASEELRAQLAQAERGAQDQAARMTETATAMQQMNSTVLEVARNAGAASEVTAQTRHRAEDGEKIVREAIRSIGTVQAQSLALKNDMAELGDTTRSISQIMGVISDIADQTNLLALNAAIEAARAGEAGRGFAVVADEVRKLAEKTMASTTDVANAIRAIQQSAEKNMTQVDTTVQRIEEATALATQSGETLAEIVRMVDNAADQVRAIATASEEQSATSEQINQSMEQINHITLATAHTMRESTDAVQSLARQAQELSGLISDMKRS